MYIFFQSMRFKMLMCPHNSVSSCLVSHIQLFLLQRSDVLSLSWQSIAYCLWRVMTVCMGALWSEQQILAHHSLLIRLAHWWNIAVKEDTRLLANHSAPVRIQASGVEMYLSVSVSSVPLEWRKRPRHRLKDSVNKKNILRVWTEFSWVRTWFRNGLLCMC